MRSAGPAFRTPSRPAGRGFWFFPLSQSLGWAVGAKRPFIDDDMSHSQGFMKALKCRECGHEYALSATHVCEFDFGPLEVAYDYDRIKAELTRAVIQARPQTTDSA